MKQTKARRWLLLCFCLMFLCSCATGPGYDEGYSKGYNEGYAAGLAMAQAYADTRTAPEPEPTIRPTAKPVSTPSPTAKASLPTPKPTPTLAPTANDFVVYVSRSGTMHLKPNCSGMKYYTEMPYSVASQYYSKKCSHCFK